MSPSPRAKNSTARGCAPLRADEIGQIAGRAGRYMNDGTFGVTGDCEPFEDELVSRIETHRYDPVRVLQWRNAALDFRSLAQLASKAWMRRRRNAGLTRARPASDAMALKLLSGDDEVSAPLATSRDAVRKLWDVCQLPDFRKLSTDDHVRLVQDHLPVPDGRTAPFPMTGWRARSPAPMSPKAMSPPCRDGWRRSAPSPMPPIAPGWTRDGAHWQGDHPRRGRPAVGCAA